MNIDIRLSIGFWQHPKTRKLAKRLGLEGVRSLQILWLWAAQNRPDGNLSGMDWEDIELAADWSGEERTFFDFCLGVWIDEASEGYSLHDWAEHNPWQAECEARREQARKNAKSGWEKRKKAQSHDFGNADSMPPQSDGNAGAKRLHEIGNAPSPSPSPTLRKEDILNTPLYNSQADRAPTPAVGGGGREGYLEPSGVDENTPSVEFQELRVAYNERGRVEAPLAGLPEYFALKKSRQWPGQSPIYDAIDRLSAQDGPWRAGKAPGLAKFLKEQWWRMRPRPAARASPQPPPGHTVTERNEATAMRVLAEMEAENGN